MLGLPGAVMWHAGRMPSPDSVVWAEGPWTHREISANGMRFHAVESGEGPLVVLLHGFPQFWWAMREPLTQIAAAGYRCVAPDLRGYGGSDKPPRGYDAVTLAADVAGLIRALGGREAVLVGHDWGGFAAWTTAALHPGLVRGLVILSAAHPLRARAALFTDPGGQLRASKPLLAFQLPWWPERALVARTGERVAQLLQAWSVAPWADDEALRRYREHICIPHVAHSALEYFRWWMRSQFRPDGARFARLLRRCRIRVPTLQVHGDADPHVLPRTAAGSGRYVDGWYSWRVVDGAGHFLTEEKPKLVCQEVLHWLDELDRGR